MNSLNFLLHKTVRLRTAHLTSFTFHLRPTSSQTLRCVILRYVFKSMRIYTGYVFLFVRYKSTIPSEDITNKRNWDSLYYGVSLGVIAIGFTFAAIPAYRIFCEQTSFGGTTQVAKDFEKIEKMEKVKDRLIQVQFNADVPSSMQWNFKPLQNEIYVHPGETALAFFTGIFFGNV